MVNPLNINVESQRVIMEYIVDAQNICTNLLDTIYQYFLVLDLSFFVANGANFSICFKADLYIAYFI